MKLNQSKTYAVAEGLKIQVTIEENLFQLEPTALFKMAARINKKRSFLFVSPILGKHLPVNPALPLLAGRALALIYSDDYQEQQPLIQKAFNHSSSAFDFNQAALPKVTADDTVTIIGFCETATALGQAFFESFASTATYIHTTREQLAEAIKPSLAFEEEHSHATAHKVYALNPAFLQDASEVILVDDEVTTGQTNLNIIRDIVKEFPQKRIFSIVSLLDWRSEAHEQAFRELEEELAITIKEFSLLKGQVKEIGTPANLAEESLVTTKNTAVAFKKRLIPAELLQSFHQLHLESLNANGELVTVPYLAETGRFGLNGSQNQIAVEKARHLGEYLQELRAAGDCLVLGTGEFMYLPMRVASFMGPEVVFHTTTRSPILSRSLPEYPIFNKRSFRGIEQPGVTNFVYTIPQNHYRDIFIMLERAVDLDGLGELQQQLAACVDANLYLVDFSQNCLYQSQKC